MSYISSILGKRSLSLVAQVMTTSLMREIDMVFPLKSVPVAWTNPATFRNRYTSTQLRNMVMITHTSASVDSGASTKRSDISSGQVQGTETVSTKPENHALSVFVTEACFQRIHHLISLKERQDLYLRVFVDAGGCSGFTYQFEIDSDENLKPDDDVIFTESSMGNNGIEPARVVVDKGSLQLIAGSKIDYVQEMIKSSFEVRENPQSESACGCGSSFALKNFASNPAAD